MKKQFFLLPLLGAMIAGCSSDNAMTNNGTLPESYANSYLSVSVMGANSAGIRAAGDIYGQDDEKYQDGTEAENKVNEVRFFFFYNNGDPAMVQKTTTTGTYLSYLDLDTDTKTEGGPNQNETVEKIIETTLRLNIPDGHANPNKVLAVINPTSAIKDLNNPSWGEIKDQIENYKMDGNTKLTDDNFVMSNSVYANDDKEVFDAQILKDINFQTTDKAAEENPVKMYVERVLARLDFSLSMTGNKRIELSDGNIIYKLNVPEGNTNDRYEINDKETPEDGTASDEKITSKEEDIYVKFLGWNITGTPTESRLVKEINGEWTTEDLFGTDAPRWTTTDYHRSFWALNPNLGDAPTIGNYQTNDKYEFVSFKEATLPIPTSEESTKTTYLQENANGYSTDKEAAAPDYATQVIIAAQLVNADGTDKTLAKWLNGYYTLEGVKTAMANMLPDLYTEEENGDYVRVKPGDLTLKQATIEGAKKYYAQATVDTENKTWYEKIGNEYKEITDVNNGYIYTKLGYALVWTTGKTYYYFDIQHLGKKEGSVGWNGVVRNHIYKTDITSIAGLGTPVYDPDEEIFPEKPTKESIISAKVNILSWRIVTHDYDLVW